MAFLLAICLFSNRFQSRNNLEEFRLELMILFSNINCRLLFYLIEKKIPIKIRDEQDKDLAIEKNWRVELQTELAEKQEQIKVLNEKLNYLNQLEQVLNIYYKFFLLKVYNINIEC